MALDGRRRDTFWWPRYAIAPASAMLSLPIVYWVTYLDRKQNPPPCFGLGWECTLGAGATVAFFGVLIALPGLIVAFVVLAGTGFAGSRTRLLRLWVAGAVLPALIVGIFLFG